MHLRRACVIGVVSFMLQAMPVRRAHAEDRLDFKVMHYQEEKNRMQIVAPTFVVEKDLSSTLTLKIDGIFNSISGATPNGAPSRGNTTVTTIPAPSAQPSYESERQDNNVSYNSENDEEEEDEGDDRVAARSNAAASLRGRTRDYRWRAGATPVASAPQPQAQPQQPQQTQQPVARPQPAARTTTSVPWETISTVEDERLGVNAELSKRLESQTVSVGVSYSSETDYTSYGVAARDAIDFNQKNTTLLVGGAYTYDNIDTATGVSGTKKTIDLGLGVVQALTPKTLLSVNLVLSTSQGLLLDPYKVVELNGALEPERRPDERDKFIVFMALNQYIESLRGSIEASGRLYSDTFGLSAETFELAWYQKLGESLVLKPVVRIYTQSEADFYDISFTGSPEFYSSDYRLSDMTSMGYGMKVIWKISSTYAVDLAYDRYEQSGNDGKTPDWVYPSANVVTMGVRIWF